ncbi:MAG TPA: SMC-Scp complex subunit ScpB [Planctomycetota bacterium]|nr:SMC-Scp complex subunit ScpB [Planctomycetota bacterium]MDP7245451.1 SMC-Scp complex subunit ScpB [Planctomycetota bacterium]MDP7559176.1 SMC-Scp complex subunit ScpB [Planctomycetota bacterium]HJM39249.1 SMC-Scp complex subunit ScpB [Planctomycetota bacterium]
MSPSENTPPEIQEDQLRVLFALLFSSPDPVGMDRIREILVPQSSESEADTAEELHSPRQFLDALEAWMEERRLPLVLKQVGRAWRLLTCEEVAEALEPVRKRAQSDRLGPAALEVLALIAYRQPVLKADIDAIRGVKSGPHLRHLLDLKLIRILGRAELPGRPFLYGTTREFLDKFGLRNLSELPEAGRLALPVEEPPSQPEVDSPAETEHEVE